MSETSARVTAAEPMPPPPFRKWTVYFHKVDDLSVVDLFAHFLEYSGDFAVFVTLEPTGRESSVYALPSHRLLAITGGLPI